MQRFYCALYGVHAELDDSIVKPEAVQFPNTGAHGFRNSVLKDNLAVVDGIYRAH